MAENVTVNHGEGREGISESDYDPDYLKHIIKEYPDLGRQFQEIIGECRKISDVTVHDATAAPSARFTIFYRYFFTKYVSTLQGNDARSGMIEKHASIFPFRTNRDLQAARVPVAELYDEGFLNEIREFVHYHFGNEVDFEHLKNSFLTNIDHFKRQHFGNPPLLGQLTRIIGIGSNWRRSNSPPEFLSDYLNDFIRLNDAGTKWYRYFQARFNVVCKLYNKEFLMLPEKSESYFKYLPEINCCELLLLLETDFYQLERRKYTRIFRKYLFFFGNAIERSDSHAVCFIDETLFTCLQFKKKYETFRGDILDLQWELWMMTLVHHRKHPVPENPKPSLRPDENNLRHVIKYTEQIQGIQSAVVYYGEPQYPRFKVFLLLDDSVFLISYSRDKEESVVGQILKSALLSPEIKELKYYNARSGKVITYGMPPRRQEIRNFIHKLTLNEVQERRLEPLYPEKFLIRNLKKYFTKYPCYC